MKKIALVLSCLVLFLPVGIEASELGDNSLQIDSSRIEVEKEKKIGNQDLLVQSLFLAPDQAELTAKKEADQVLLEHQLNSLFQTGEKPSTDILQVGTLFDTRTHKVMTTKVDSGTEGAPAGLLSGLFFASIVVGILLLASLATYLMGKDEVGQE
ncbi:TPA: type VII secretion protein EssA [Streptococcus suis]|nr:type VII secretion protein EssA [Streptococcus suis]HEM5057878.1 type VII secretion protein EssA [Streptococcus suis]HEM5068337.1 type VII secretion protein EssA [Streptococcus suis]HEM5165001.1 type VII secretion protein EssA [Streptococcus suis]HEM5287682.1 type VII secretion protein EssA [Streptococcus suis]